MQAYAEEKALQALRQDSSTAAETAGGDDGKATATPSRQPGVYEVPDWAGVPAEG